MSFATKLIRCLEDGAKEFILKPVQLSDLSKLRPHLSKWRCKDSPPQAEKKNDWKNVTTAIALIFVFIPCLSILSLPLCMMLAGEHDF